MDTPRYVSSRTAARTAAVHAAIFLYGSVFAGSAAEGAASWEETCAGGCWESAELLCRDSVEGFGAESVELLCRGSVEGFGAESAELCRELSSERFCWIS